jgi:hypothetical protein
VFTSGGTSEDKRNSFIRGIVGIAAIAATSYAGGLGKSATVAISESGTAAILKQPSVADQKASGIYGLPQAARGGIATGPVIAGEGRMNEAIIPLPDGKSVPVMMQGNSSNSNNNIQISVNVGQGGQTTQTTGDTSAQAGLMARAIASAVTSELQRQKRPGGLLSPYGPR